MTLLETLSTLSVPLTSTDHAPLYIHSILLSVFCLQYITHNTVLW